MAAAEGGRFRGKVPQWRHAKCFLDMGEWTSPMADMSGWTTLSPEDQAQIEGPTSGNVLFFGHHRVLVAVCIFIAKRIILSLIDTVVL